MPEARVHRFPGASRSALILARVQLNAAANLVLSRLRGLYRK